MARMDYGRLEYAPLAEDAARQLARFVVGTRFADLPEDVAGQARRCTLDCLGVAVAAFDEPSLPILEDVLDILGGNPQATAWLTGNRMNVANAAQYNGHLAHVLDMDDTYSSDDTTIHIYAVVVPAALAMAEWKGSSGAEYLRAMTLGYEVMARAAISAGKSFHRQRWHVSGVVGTFGAAAAAGAILGLDEDQMTNAFGIVGAQGALLEIMGTMTKAYQMGRASMHGVVAALLAQRGFTGAKDVFGGKFGFHATFHSDQDWNALLGELGSRWEIRRAGLKPFACGVGQHSMLQGVINVRDRHSLTPDAIDAIEITCNPSVLVPNGNRTPRVGLEGKFSLFHAAAAAFVDGVAGPAQFTDARVQDPTVIAIRDTVKVVKDETMRRGSATVRIRLRDGRTVEDYVPYGPGTINAPLTDEQLHKKFHGLVAPVLGMPAAVQLMDAVGGIELLPSLERLLQPMRGRHRQV